ncbi:MAG: CPBP family intramembrane glutamic endopeptidase [Enterococcus sp.]
MEIEKQARSLGNIFIGIVLVFAGYLLLTFGVIRPIAQFWLVITGLIACQIAYGHPFALFKKMKFKDIGLILGGVVSAFAIGYCYIFLSYLLNLSGNANPVTHAPGLSTFLLFIPGLLGEELLVLVPVSLVIHHLAQKGPVSKKAIIFIALISSFAFGALHLPTYQWNWIQCLVAIGLIRVPFTYIYLKTKNILPAFLTHYVYDSIIIIIAILINA